MKGIVLKDGEVAIVDDEDYLRCHHMPWRLSGEYVTCYWQGEDYILHRFIMQAQEGTEVHHQDLDPLNNTRQNLEVLTPSEHKTRHNAVTRTLGRAKRRRGPAPKGIRFLPDIPPMDWHAIDRDYRKRGV